MRNAGYRPREYYESEPDLRAAIDAIAADRFSGGVTGRFAPLLDALLTRDDYFVLPDFSSYAQCQRRVDMAWSHEDNWTRMSILNTARCGRFSSDRAIREYCERIWQVERVPVPKADV
jgi:starch phosphorylase